MAIPQSTINSDPAPGVPGAFCSANPRGSMIAGPGQLTAGAAGLIVGRFGWAKNSDGTVTNANPGVASRLGFVHREQFAFINAFPFGSGNTVPGGYEVTLFDSGDFWMGPFASGATIGQKVFVSYADGTVSAAAAGASVTASGTTASTTNGSPNLTAVSGSLFPGEPISGTGIPAGATVVSVSGTTAVISANATATGSGVALTRTTAFETKWYVDSTAGSNEIAMTSTRG